MEPDRNDLVDVADFIPGIGVDVRYAGVNHGFGRAFYTSDRARLRRGTAEKLRAAQEALTGAGYGLLVWDAYRPLSVQARMWEINPDPSFVAPPERGSRHNRGAAVDVTLIDLSGRELEMPTDFDQFTGQAHSECESVSPTALRHREILRNAMLAAGFTGINNEWWHFDDPDWRDYDLLDV